VTPLTDEPRVGEPRIGERGTDAAVLETLASSLRGWIERVSLAEGRLAAFAFRENGPAVDVPPATSYRYFIGRILGSAADPSTLRLLDLARGPGASFAELVGRDDLGVEPGDRVALAERVAAAAASGLVGRELDGDRVACTPLGEAVLDLVEHLESRLDHDGTPSTGGRPPGTATR
jgi:hypothetical protein